MKKIKKTDPKRVFLTKYFIYMLIPIAMISVGIVAIVSMFQVWGIYTLVWMIMAFAAGNLGESMKWSPFDEEDYPEDKK